MISKTTCSGFVLLLLAVKGALGYNVLFMPSMAGSHLLMFGGVAKSVIKQGHRAFMVKHRSVPAPSQLVNSGIEFVNFGATKEIHYSLTDEFATFLSTMSNASFFDRVPPLYRTVNKQCQILRNEDLFQTLKELNFSFAVVDNVFALECFYAIPYRLGIPYANLMVVPPLHSFSLTLQTHFITPTFPLIPYSAVPSFYHRFLQFVAILISNAIVRHSHDLELIRNFTKESMTDISKLRSNVKLWFVDMDPVVQGAKHSSPSVIYVGGLSSGPPEPLPTHIAEFANAAKEGLVVVSFGGSLTSIFPSHQIEKLMEGLEGYKIIMRLKNKPTYVPKNAMFVDWIPQNDLLGHSNTVLFVTHCGTSSVNEAVYHSVPMLGIPFHDEQIYNAVQMAHRGFGDYLDRNSFRAEDVKNLTEKLLKRKFKEHLANASAIMKSRRLTPGDEAAYWVDHVIKYGAEHLIPYTVEMHWWEILMFDILAALVIALALLLMLLWKCCKFWWRCCLNNGKMKAQ